MSARFNREGGGDNLTTTFKPVIEELTANIAEKEGVPQPSSSATATAAPLLNEPPPATTQVDTVKSVPPPPPSPTVNITLPPLRDNVEEESDSDSSSSALTNLSPCCENRRIRRTFETILLGQLMSLCLCGTGVASQLLANHKFNSPAAQSFLNYFLLAFTYGLMLLFRRGDNKNFNEVLRLRGWKYFLLAIIDVEANFLVIYSYQLTNITSVQLLDCFTIPVVMLLSWLFLSVRYLSSHIGGVGICLVGISIIIYADAKTGRGAEGGSNPLMGDLMAMAAFILYGFANVCEEWLVKHNDRSEYLGLIGLFGAIISGTQLAIFESDQLARVQWTSSVIAFYLLFTVCMFLFYSMVSIVMRRSSALMFNLAVLTADFYSLLAGVFIFKMEFQLLYLIAFIVVMAGSTIYSFKKTKTKESSYILSLCCPWIPLCCEECIPSSPPKTDYTVQDAQAERSTSQSELHSEINSSVNS